jgi:hypothetical protein
MMNKLTPSHFGKFHAGNELEWLPTDTKENYEKLIQDPENCKYFAEMGWDQPGAITYKLNSHGFRCDEFSSGPYVVALGCSFTVGIGLPLHDTWAYKVGEALNLKVANLGWGGYSADTCYRLAEYWVPELRPDYVCMLAPPESRFELLLEDSQNLPFEVFLPGGNSQFYNSNDQYINHWFLNDENAKINQRKNILAVRQLCSDLNIPCTVINALGNMHWNAEVGYARDYMHAGPIAHKLVANKFVDKYSK